MNQELLIVTISLCILMGLGILIGTMIYVKTIRNIKFHHKLNSNSSDLDRYTISPIIIWIKWLVTHYRNHLTDAFYIVEIHRTDKWWQNRVSFVNLLERVLPQEIIDRWQKYRWDRPWKKQYFNILKNRVVENTPKDIEVIQDNINPDIYLLSDPRVSYIDQQNNNKWDIRIQKAEKRADIYTVAICIVLIVLMAFYMLK